MTDDKKLEKKEEYRANFLWPPEEGSIEQAGYEFANGLSESYRKGWWGILLERAREKKPEPTSSIRVAAEKFCAKYVLTGPDKSFIVQGLEEAIRAEVERDGNGSGVRHSYLPKV
jgi:hypothetical protein